MTSEPAAADYFTTGAFMQKKHGGRLNLRYSEGNISCRTLPIVERKAALDTQGHMRSPDIEYFTAERPDFSSQYHFKASQQSLACSMFATDSSGRSVTSASLSAQQQTYLFTYCLYSFINCSTTAGKTCSKQKTHGRRSASPVHHLDSCPIPRKHPRWSGDNLVPRATREARCELSRKNRRAYFPPCDTLPPKLLLSVFTLALRVLVILHPVAQWVGGGGGVGGYERVKIKKFPFQVLPSAHTMLCPVQEPKPSLTGASVGMGQTTRADVIAVSLQMLATPRPIRKQMMHSRSQTTIQHFDYEGLIILIICMLFVIILLSYFDYLIIFGYLIM